MLGHLATLLERGLPELGDRGRGVDGARDLGVRARTDEERDVAFSTRGQELLRGTRIVGARDDLARGELGVVTGAVALGDNEGQLGDRGVEDLDVVARVVGRGVARAQLRRERLAGRIGEAKQGMEPVMPISE